MKITKITRKDLKYIVHFAPNFLEFLFGVGPKTKEYRLDGKYTFGGGGVYIGQDGEQLDNGNWIGEAIDRFRRSW